ncbi:U3 small nucleolar ribonucleoprotein IMP4-like [Petromyzon marinus]|uniref:U3 small nucleolar ribonucleoprotein IMP4-like n=1 Tax=Petromyzon marinus TaxID=7757 RepID=UPI003F7301B7
MEMKLILPNAQPMNRGGHKLEALVRACCANTVTDFIILHEHRDGIVMCHLPLGPTAYLTARHPDVDTMSKALPHLVMHNFTSRLGKRAQRLQARRQGHRVEGGGTVIRDGALRVNWARWTTRPPPRWSGLGDRT